MKYQLISWLRSIISMGHLMVYPVTLGLAAELAKLAMSASATNFPLI
jgi:hypothetical protein